MCIGLDWIEFSIYQISTTPKIMSYEWIYCLSIYSCYGVVMDDGSAGCCEVDCLDASLAFWGDRMSLKNEK